MAKGSPDKKSNKKVSPNDKKGSKKDSPSKKGSKKSIKVTDNVIENNKLLLIRKSVGTSSAWEDYRFINFRCPTCFLILDSFQQFMNHECWRTYYKGRFHFGENQSFICRTCDRLFQTKISYSLHKCDKMTAEDILPITYRMHFKFFMYWDRRNHKESIEYNTDWTYVCRCIKCGNKFKREILYVLHSCFQYSLLKPIEVKCLKICKSCKFIFITENQYNLHLSYCPREDRAFCNRFLNTTFFRTCQQFVLGRHCYDFDLHITQKPLEVSDIVKKSLKVGCNECNLVKESVLEFLYHPCVAGKLIAPADLEMTLVCNKCRCLFLNYENCENHLKHCCATNFTFLRFNITEIKLAIERWVTDVLFNPYLPIRPKKIKCQYCLEVFCDLSCCLKHLCPKKRRFERILIPPISLSEMYVCESCTFIFFTTTEAVNHAENCPSKPLMIQIHPDMNEALIGLEVWSQLPRLLQMEIIIGCPEVHEKCPRGESDDVGICSEECRTICK